MALEDLTGTKYINSLVSTNPTSTDNKSEGDDHLRGIKNVVKLSFPNISGAVTATHTELNALDGITSTTAELNYNDGATSGTTLTTGDISDSSTIALDGDFTSGSIRCYKIKAAYTITWNTAGHASASSASSSTGLIPAAYRPGATTYCTSYADGTKVVRVTISSTGVFSAQYIDWTGANSNQTQLPSGTISFTYIV